MRQKTLAPLFLLLLVGAVGELQASCTAAKCADCDFSGPGSGAMCKLFPQNGWCECSVIVMFNDTACGMNGECTYNSSEGGGETGGSGGGSTTTCTRLPGAVCPAECDSCSTVFWYN